MQLKETKTVRGGPECPTLLHYLARVLMRKDPLLNTFIDEMPNLEAAARCIYRCFYSTIWLLRK